MRKKDSRPSVFHVCREASVYTGASVCVCVYKRTYIRVNTLVMKFHRTSMSDINDS